MFVLKFEKVLNDSATFSSYLIFSGLGIRSLVFWANRSKKTSNLLICSFLVSNLRDLLMVTHFWWATWANHSWSLIFAKWATWAIRSHCSFLVSNLSGITHYKRGNEQIARVFFTYKKRTKKYDFSQSFLSELLIHSFFMSDLSKLLMVAHFWWATWAIRSHGSFLVSDLSDALTSLIKKEGMSKLLVFIL